MGWVAAEFAQLAARDRLNSSGGLYAIRLGGDGAKTRLVCGFLGCDSVEGNLLISTLPRALRLSVEEGSAAE